MLTYSDLIEHATDQLGGAADNRQQSFIRRAVVNSFRRVAYHPKGWRYYVRRARVNLNALYSTGTVSYTNTTRTFELTGGVFPDWSPLGEIRVNDLIYEIESRPTTTTVVIKALNAPTEDINGGTSYEVFQTAYPLPIDFQDIYIVENEQVPYPDYVTPQTWFSMQRTNGATGTPRFWTILGNNNSNTYGGKSIHVYPIPTSAAPLEFLMRRTPRAMRYSGQEAACITGTVTASSGGVAITGSGTSFAARMVGSILRLTDGAAIPNGLGGLEPYVDELVISAYSNATSITTATNTSQSFTAAKFRISDPVDADDCMISAILRAVEYELAVQRNASDAAVGRAKSLFTEELVRAWEADAMAGVDRAGIPFFPCMSDGTDVYSVEVD